MCFVALNARSQYYLRGSVYDENGKGIYNVKIILQSKGTMPFYTGASGAFGIPVSVTADSITLQADGYEILKTIVKAGLYQSLVMKFSAGATVITRHKLVSVIHKNKDEISESYSHSGETYTTLIENDFTQTGQFPETGFALNINRASYSNIRRFLNMDMKVPPDAVRIEEMLNYFDLSDKIKNNTAHFTCNTQLTQAPWNKNNRLLFINLKAPVLNVDNIAPANLVFLIDVSGSMDQPNRLPLIKDAFKMLVNNLRKQDTVAIVMYGGTVGTWLAPTSGMYKDSIKTAIEKLEAGGETPGEAAIKTAYALAEKIASKNANNRIILATDGDFNVGQTRDKELEDIVVTHRQSGIALTCLGVGMGNYKDSKLEALAKKGNGNFAYLDNIHEAEKVMVTEFTKTMYSVANNAYINISFNPAYINSYRLIGFDNKKELPGDTTSELEGGEVGTGHSFMAVFEIKPAAGFIDTAEHNSDMPVAQLTLHYQLTDNDAEVTQPFTVINNYIPLNQTNSRLRFATALIMFGGLLKQSDLWKNYTWTDVINITQASMHANEFAETEFLKLAEKAKKMYAPVKKKKRKRNTE
ncbi:MAG: von Willebrand factor type A domain-containing protein [Panacibacter sp.]